MCRHVCVCNNSGVLSVTVEISPPGFVVLGSTVSLVCGAVSEVEPVIFLWTRSDGMNISHDDTDGTISVTFSSNANYGTYTCTATNGDETGTKDVEVLRGKEL